MHDRQPLKPLEAAFLADVCKALAHPARVRILKHLLDENRCICGSIVDILPLAQSTVSQHLKILKDAGLVRGEVEGRKTCYCANRELLSRFNGFIEAMLRQSEGRVCP
jgi:DNA-binding transcriptional ArsR family regulator